MIKGSASTSNASTSGIKDIECILGNYTIILQKSYYYKNNNLYIGFKYKDTMCNTWYANVDDIQEFYTC